MEIANVCCIFTTVRGLPDQKLHELGAFFMKRQRWCYLHS